MERVARTGQNTVALVAVCLAALMFGLEISSVPVILPTLETALHSDFKEVQWIMNAYTIACTTVLMATGTLADRFGRKRVFIISILLFGITSLLCGLAQSTLVLIISRFLQGMGGGAMLICSIAILSHQFREGRERGRAFGMWGIISGVGLGFGPIIGGAIVMVSNWQWVFLVHVGIAIITALLVFRGVQESRDPQAKKLDVAGIISLSLAVFGLAYYITQGQVIGFRSMAGLGILGGAVISFIIFLRVEKQHAHPMFDFSVFRIRRFSGAIIGCIGMNFSFWPFMIYLPIYFQSALGYDIITAGLSLLAYTLPTLVVPPLAERLTLRYQARVIIPMGLLMIGVGFLIMYYGSSVAHASWLTMLPGSLLAGIGLSLTNTPVTNTTTGAVTPDRAGMASGIDMSARLITLAINIALMGFILVEGIYSYLESNLPGAMATAPLHASAEKIAVGLSATDISEATAHAALVHGFGWVMLFGGIGVCVLALVSLLIFGIRPINKK
ncbi:DHA2 family efflux MFS transporter permease subunit [Paraflavitalea soli]|uniref:DHA2 family efflux MFS transporter permease subunit n=1 Tax=Paraflavitalea soli TaxID=2315862 RepID=A0A3B7MYW2_9BACT|nr:MFS transporter [Paraflavitalea soli]AXY78409.1 DHA2 family efflux MFS transporter permease subunit [Paraflavitalea soli]